MSETSQKAPRPRKLASLERLRAAERWPERLKELFFLPGNLACDWLRVEEPESRYLLRMFVNLAVYSKLAVLVLLPFLGH